MRVRLYFTTIIKTKVAKIENETSFLKHKTKRDSTPGQNNMRSEYKSHVAWSMLGEEPNIHKYFLPMLENHKT